MSSIFDAVKEAVPVPVAAERYDLHANRTGMVCCPFHDDHHPSLKLNERYFYCFGCGAKGSVVDLTALLYNLRPYEAANKLAADFGVDASAVARPCHHRGGCGRGRDQHPVLCHAEEDSRHQAGRGGSA